MEKKEKNCFTLKHMSGIKSFLHEFQRALLHLILGEQVLTLNWLLHYPRLMVLVNNDHLHSP